MTRFSKYVGAKRFLIAALLLLLLGLYHLSDAWRFMRVSEASVGKVVATGRYPGRRRSFRACRYQSVLFTTHRAQDVCVVFDDMAWFDPTPIGTDVPVRYNEAKPREARPDSWFYLWGIAAIEIIIGLSAIACFLRMNRRSNGKNSSQDRTDIAPNLA